MRSLTEACSIVQLQKMAMLCQNMCMHSRHKVATGATFTHNQGHASHHEGCEKNCSPLQQQQQQPLPAEVR